ncbi:MAG: M48 family metalloprotease [Gammaproteobacteria bacterium]|nr:M48 family metalloprotease [Gammaproteobacteria bacterium]
MTITREGECSYSIPAFILLWVCACSFPAQAAQEFRERANHHQLAAITNEDVRAEIEFGQTVAARILGQFKIVTNDKLNHYVNLVGTGIAQHSARTELNYRFAVLDNDGVNAFSAPGGYIFVTRGALAIMEDESELAAVLAHEIAHVTERHIVNALHIQATDTSTGAGLGRLFSAGSDTARVVFFQAIDQAVKILFEEGYDKQAELDADRVATLLLADSGYDPTALRRYIGKTSSLENKNGSDINRTHPPSRNRLQQLDQLLLEEKLIRVSSSKLKTRFEEHVKTQH